VGAPVGRAEAFATPRAVWSAGDFSRIAGGVLIVSEELCEAAELHAQESVLDVATGTGNTALAAARRRCRVTGIDVVPELLEHARRRAEAEQLRVEFRPGDIERNDLPAASFDCVTSTFGVIFAAAPDRAAAELLRVCRPGGRIALACWSEAGFTGPLLACAGRYLPSGSGASDPLRWSRADQLARWFAVDGARLSVTARTVRLRADSVESQIEGLERFLGPVVAARAAADPTARAALHAEMVALAERANRADDGTFLADSDYVEVLVRRDRT
jgi:SAM-dependent methyltransferase